MQKLLEKSDGEKNDREKQGINKLKAENKIISREISSKNNYQREDEEKRNEEFKRKQNEIKVKQTERKNKKPNPFQPSENRDSNEIKLEGVDRAEAEGMVDESRMKAELEKVEIERKIAESNKAKNSKNIKVKNSKKPKTATSKNSAEPVPYRPAEEDGWGGDNWWEADDPDNEVGNPPGASPDAEAGNGNFQFTAPVVSLPGRGIDINLALSYNSRVWSKSGNTMSFDSDKGNPAPGWNLGFGKMIYMGSNGGCMLVDADGTRKAYSGSNSTYSYGSYFSNSFTGHTSDNSFTDYTCYYSSSTYGTYLSGSAKLANGTVVYYGSQSAYNDQVYPTQITDPNGNYITITYQNNQGPNITTVTDTLGRVINFNYDSSNRLISVTVPGFNGGSTRTAVQLHYSQLTLGYNFGSLAVDYPTNTPWVIDSIFYPANNTGYWFGEQDSYSSYGMIQKVAERRQMSSTGTTTNQGTVNPGSLSNTKLAVYNFLTSGSLSDAPTYDTLTESWDGITTDPAVTLYNVNKNDSKVDIFGNNVACYTTKVTQPNGLISKQYAYKTNGWTDGLIFADETIKIVNNAEVVISSSQVRWVLGVYDSPVPTETKETNENQQVKRTELTYGVNHNQVISKKEFGYNNELLRETKTDYVLNAGYSNPYWYNRHIFSLVKYQEVYDGPTGLRQSRTEYEYDNNPTMPVTQAPNLAPATGVIMHNYTSDPFTTVTQDGDCIGGQWNYSECYYEGQIVYTGDYPQWEDNCHFTCNEYEQVSAYDPNTVFRGNVTKITSYADAQSTNPSQSVVTTKQYDITGNVVAETAACCELKTYEYAATNQYAYPTKNTRGSGGSGTANKNVTLTTYDFNTGLVTSTTNPNGQMDTTTYDVNTLRATVLTSSTGAYTQTNYNDSAMTVSTETHEYGGNLASQNTKYLNGIGKVKKEEALGESSVVDVVETLYTNLGQIWKQSNPYRGSGPIYWTENGYDVLGRTIWIKSPDDSISYAYYNETARPSSASALAGETIRQVDAWGRERWSRTNALGQMAEVVEPNPDSNGLLSNSGNLVTNYEYDVNNNLTKSIQGSQIREFRYDTLNRMVRQKLAEQSATIDNNGAYVGVGGTGAYWSGAVTYDSRSNIIQKVDARGVKTNYLYQLPSNQGGGEDPLNRLWEINYDLSGSHDTTKPIAAVPPTNYLYETGGDQTRIKSVTTQGVSTEEYFYTDGQGRVNQTTLTLLNRTNYPMTTGYVYDSLHRITQTLFPAQYGMTGSPRKQVNSYYDVAGRLSSLVVNSQQQAGNIVYNASSQTTAINVGPTGANQIQEQYTFDPVTGLMVNQQVVNANNFNVKLLNLSYDYARNNSAGNTDTAWKTGALTKISNNLDHNKDREYIYDSIGRLRFAKGGVNGALSQQEYVYDRFGNRTNVNLAANSVAADNSAMPRDGIATLAYDTATNRITTSNGTGQFEYDVAGNQTRALAENQTDWNRFEYDAANRLVAIMPDTGTTPIQTQEFSVGNIRLSLTDYVSNQRTYYDGATEYTESANNGTLVWSKGYVYLGDKILSSSAPNGSGGETIEFYHPDKLGTRVITNQVAGTSVEQTTLPFGTSLGAESSSSGLSSKRFTSYERSARTGLDYAQNRTYDSKQGRFTQVDPFGMKAANLLNPQSLNMYNYVGNDPINRTDPTGLFWGALGRFFKAVWKVIKFIAKIVATIVTILITVAYLVFKNLTTLGLIIGAKNQCQVPDFNGLSQNRQEELTQRGVSPDQWNGLKNKQRLGYFNIVAAIAAVGFSLAGWVVDWDKDKGIQQDRTFFVAGQQATNLVGLVKSSGLFSKDIFGGHKGYEDSWRKNVFYKSLQMSFDPATGRKLEVDIDIFNPNIKGGYILGTVLHALGELVPHSLASLFGGSGRTNPYNVAYKSSWECK